MPTKQFHHCIWDCLRRRRRHASLPPGASDTRSAPMGPSLAPVGTTRHGLPTERARRIHDPALATWHDPDAPTLLRTTPTRSPTGPTTRWWW